MIERRQKLFTTPNDGGIIQASPAQAVAVAQALNILAPRRKYKRRRWRSSSRLSARRARSGQPVAPPVAPVVPALPVIVSDSFDALGVDESIFGRNIDNALGGSGTYQWQSTESGDIPAGDGSGAIEYVGTGGWRRSMINRVQVAQKEGIRAAISHPDSDSKPTLLLRDSLSGGGQLKLAMWNGLKPSIHNFSTSNTYDLDAFPIIDSSVDYRDVEVYLDDDEGALGIWVTVIWLGQTVTEFITVSELSGITNFYLSKNDDWNHGFQTAGSSGQVSIDSFEIVDYS